MFSDSKSDDKIKFLFEIFDFNESATISILDLEFLISCVLKATSKIFNLGEKDSRLEI